MDKSFVNEIDQLVLRLQQLEVNTAEILLSTVAYAHNENDVEPLNDFVFELVNIQGFTFSLNKIVHFLESNFQVFWDHTKDQFSLKSNANRVSEARLSNFTVDSVMDSICGDDIPYSEISYRKRKDADNDKFMKTFMSDDSYDEYGRFGIPQDKRYNKYRIRIKRK
jgi:hypothetical protein